MKERALKKGDRWPEISIGGDEPVYTSGVVTRLLKIPVWVLKQLDRESVVRPPRKTKGSSRLYSHNELRMLKQVWYYMHEKGVNIEGVKVILRVNVINK